MSSAFKNDNHRYPGMTVLSLIDNVNKIMGSSVWEDKFYLHVFSYPCQTCNYQMTFFVGLWNGHHLPISIFSFSVGLLIHDPCH